MTADISLTTLMLGDREVPAVIYTADEIAGMSDSLRRHARAVNQWWQREVLNLRRCAQCDEVFAAGGGAGRPRRMCSDRCRRHHRAELQRQRRQETA